MKKKILLLTLGLAILISGCSKNEVEDWQTADQFGELNENIEIQPLYEWGVQSDDLLIDKYINLKEENLDNLREGDIASALEKEGKAILDAIPQRAYKVALCVEGKSLSSEKLAELVTSAKDTQGEICFIIGSSHGLSPKVKAACDYRLSVSALTFPHRLMRVILTEAIYRALSIANGGKYHK